MYGYHEAVLSGSNSSNFVAQISNDVPFKAGTAPCAGSYNTQRYEGLLDEIKLYNCALSASQIAESAGLPDPSLPRLNIARLPNSAVRLSWTTNAPGFVLQTNGASFAPAAWNALATTPVVTDTNFVVTNAVNSPARNFRLRKP